MSSSPKILRPKPRRPYDTSTPQSPPSPLLSPGLVDDTPSRTHSILNLTSSTLLGIYSPTGYQSDLQADLPSTPSSPPTSLPVRRRVSTLPPVHKPTTLELGWKLGLRGILLFGMGMGYGLLVRHLHDDRQLAPFQVEGIIKPRNDAGYLLFWGIAGVALGSLLPWVDTLFAVPELDTPVFEKKKEEEEESESGIWGADWTPVVRSVGAFVGIAYAIRKLPWTSTLQASLTLALVNPVLWYLIDRSKPGFILSTAVGATGTALLLVSNPDMMPSPASAFNSTSKYPYFGKGNNWAGEWAGRDSIEGAVWILSVLFCSCVCFGNIGRRLALSGGAKKVVTARALKSDQKETRR
ncbi:hypothetical protein N431DRAFT_351821 [Stipitochalara longipes BDJ]|nr:hypothetical protein N431DRAFT_351821 [Stipitochalara longipes BDJ]